MKRIITLTTDFGVTDEYAGIMRGVIHSHSPQVTVVDITHGIRRHDIRQAAYLIYSAHRFFKTGTIHVIVVDPGVGTKRRIVLLEAQEQFFLAPDNGILSLFLLKNMLTACHIVDCPDLYIKPVSNSFHGRDIMAPIAAHLADGMPVNQVGPQIDCDTLTLFPLPKLDIDRNRQTITGTVVDADHFGNLITNIHLDDFQCISPSCTDNHNFNLTVRNTIISGISESYAAVTAGSILAIFGSRGFLEIAINQGGALQKLGIDLNDPVTLWHHNQ